MTYDRIRAGDDLVMEVNTVPDQDIAGFVRALVDFDIHEAAEAFMFAHPEQAGRHDFEPEEFVAWLVQNGYAEYRIKRAIHISMDSTCTLHSATPAYYSGLQPERIDDVECIEEVAHKARKRNRNAA